MFKIVYCRVLISINARKHYLHLNKKFLSGIQLQETNERRHLCEYIIVTKCYLGNKISDLALSDKGKTKKIPHKDDNTKQLMYKKY